MNTPILILIFYVANLIFCCKQERILLKRCSHYSCSTEEETGDYCISYQNRLCICYEASPAPFWACPADYSIDWCSDKNCTKPIVGEKCVNLKRDYLEVCKC